MNALNLRWNIILPLRRLNTACVGLFFLFFNGILSDGLIDKWPKWRDRRKKGTRHVDLPSIKRLRVVPISGHRGWIHSSDDDDDGNGGPTSMICAVCSVDDGWKIKSNTKLLAVFFGSAKYHSEEEEKEEEKGKSILRSLSNNLSCFDQIDEMIYMFSCEKLSNPFPT